RGSAGPPPRATPSSERDPAGRTGAGPGSGRRPPGCRGRERPAPARTADARPAPWTAPRTRPPAAPAAPSAAPRLSPPAPGRRALRATHPDVPARSDRQATDALAAHPGAPTVPAQKRLLLESGRAVGVQPPLPRR